MVENPKGQIQMTEYIQSKFEKAEKFEKPNLKWSNSTLEDFILSFSSQGNDGLIEI